MQSLHASAQLQVHYVVLIGSYRYTIHIYSYLIYSWGEKKKHEVQPNIPKKSVQSASRHVTRLYGVLSHQFAQVLFF